MRPYSRPFVLAAAAVAALLATDAAAEPARRWPLWPTEVSRAAEPLVGAPESELRLVRDSRRVAAVRDLDVFATPLVAPILVAALEDRSSAVRREVLQACLERQLLACAPAARKIWQSELDDPALRVAALRVVVLAADPDRLQLFLTALRDPDALIRAEAMRTFAAASWPKDQLAIVRTNLIAKLADPAPEVRRAAAHGLGVLGPDDPRSGRSDGALPLTRLLVDPDPQVRQDTADALARLRDPGPPRPCCARSRSATRPTSAAASCTPSRPCPAPPLLPASPATAPTASTSTPSCCAFSTPRRATCSRATSPRRSRAGAPRAPRWPRVWSPACARTRCARPRRTPSASPRSTPFSASARPPAPP
ncbi:HEAT repeat domain-containing protein [Nannocystis pusilla]|uniref:HEAT repeat domain-containing protein n=1 Tax=Nannocystis pusilla TaxID=889268 RepID=UPI003B7DAF55